MYITAITEKQTVFVTYDLKSHLIHNVLMRRNRVSKVPGTLPEFEVTPQSTLNFPEFNWSSWKLLADAMTGNGCIHQPKNLRQSSY